MKVLQLAAALSGGTGVHVATLTEGLLQSGWQVWVGAPADSMMGQTALARLACVWEKLPLDQGFSFFALKRLLNLVRAENIFLVHAHGFRAAMYGRLLRGLLGRRVRLVVTYHGYHIPFYRTRIARWCFEALERCGRRWLTDFLIFVSQSDRNLCWPEGAQKRYPHAVIPNGINLALFQDLPERASCREQLGWDQNQLVIGTVGRLRPQKNLSLLLEALSTLHQASSSPQAGRLAQIQLMVIGEGPLRTQLAALTHRLQLEDTVKFLGERTDVPCLLRALDLFVLTSRWEGCPLSVLESMAAGTPVLVTNAPGSTEVIKHGYNGVVAQPDPASVAEGIAKLATMPGFAAQLTQNALAEVHSRFDCARMVAETLAVYRRSWASGNRIAQAGKPDNAKRLK